MRNLIVCTLVLALTQAATGGIVISEWMYAGANGEFVEFTNVGPDPVDMTDWSYSDSDAQPGDVSFLEVFGVVQGGESVILTEVEPSAFRTAWGLGAGIKIFGPNDNSNLGRSDVINLYDDAGTLVDTLTYSDQAGQGPRTQNKSCNIPASDYDETTALGTWVLSWVGDEYGSWASSGGDVASPGQVPEPAGAILLAAVGFAFIWHRR